jgi:ribonuclease HI
MAKKFYAVKVGRETGVYNSWSDCEIHVKGFSGAQYKSFNTEIEALDYIDKSTASTKQAKEFQSHQLPEGVCIYTDGGASPNPGNAGCGLAFYNNGKFESAWYGCYEEYATNNRMELLAIKHALRKMKGAIQSGVKVTIFTDSEYSALGITQRAYKWKLKDYKVSSGEMRPNYKLINACHVFYNDFKSIINIEHVAAHSGIEGNEIADRMACLAIKTKVNELTEFESANVGSILKLNADI